MEQKSISQVHAYHLANFPAQSLRNDFPAKCVQEGKWQFIPGQIDVYHFMKSPEMENLFFFTLWFWKLENIFLIFKLDNLHLLK